MRAYRKKNLQLGMSFGTASSRLKKMILFDILKRHNENTCFKCKKTIDVMEELSLEHKLDWLDGDTTLFWDLNNIAFSHIRCNVKRQPIFVHGKNHGYCHGCHCRLCKDAHNVYTRRKRAELKAKKHLLNEEVENPDLAQE